MRNTNIPSIWPEKNNKLRSLKLIYLKKDCFPEFISVVQFVLAEILHILSIRLFLIPKMSFKVVADKYNPRIDKDRKKIFEKILLPLINNKAINRLVRRSNGIRFNISDEKLKIVLSSFSINKKTPLV
ncbi:hypothetical protein BAY07_19040 [Elizabethkingia bruuniana]|nr:hypothetical protein BAY07_19040 [Elizabethkingia bruuniana]